MLAALIWLNAVPTLAVGSTCHCTVDQKQLVRMALFSPALRGSLDEAQYYWLLIRHQSWPVSALVCSFNGSV